MQAPTRPDRMGRVSESVLDRTNQTQMQTTPTRDQHKQGARHVSGSFGRRHGRLFHPRVAESARVPLRLQPQPDNHPNHSSAPTRRTQGDLLRVHVDQRAIQLRLFAHLLVQLDERVHFRVQSLLLAGLHELLCAVF